jgi:hypothetical protein
MADQQMILGLALERTQNSKAFRDFAKGLLREQSRGRTIFSKAVAVLKAAPERTLDSCREMLKKVLQLNSGAGARFQSVKVEQLQWLIGLLFGEGEDLLSPQIFRDNEGNELQRERLLKYLEICRRYFFVIQAEPPGDAPAIVTKRAEKPKFDSGLAQQLAAWQAQQ